MDVDQPQEKREVDVKEVLNGNVLLIEKAVQMKETRLLMGRTLRQTATVRKKLTIDVVNDFVSR